MKKLLIRLGLLFAPFFLFWILLLVIGPGQGFRYNILNAYSDKLGEMHSWSGQKIVFVGGSNLSFSLNSELIEKELGIRPFNMGVHANIGLDFMLNSIRKEIKSGDLVVVIPEYQQYFGELAMGDLELAVLIFCVDFRYTRFLTPRQVLHLLKFIPKASSILLKSYFSADDKKPVSIVDRRSFNMYGDAIVHWTMKPIPFQPYPKLNGKPENAVLNQLKDMEAYCQSVGAKLLVSYPVYQSKSFQSSEKTIEALDVQLKEIGFDVISSPKQYAFGDSLLFNTAYHPNKLGVDLRTQMLIRDLKTVIKPN